VTTVKRPRSLGPKRASKIRSLYQLEKKDDVRKYIVRKKSKSGKSTKAPKIQRLVTSERVHRKKVIRKIKQERLEATKKAVAEYKKVVDEVRKRKQATKKSPAKEAKPAAAAAPAPKK
jgi:small subunit ribosomal protein S6e